MKNLRIRTDLKSRVNALNPFMLFARCFWGLNRHSIRSGTKFKLHSNNTSSNNGAIVDSGCRCMMTPIFSGIEWDVEDCDPDDIAAEAIYRSLYANCCDKNNATKMLALKFRTNSFEIDSVCLRDIFQLFFVPIRYT